MWLWDDVLTSDRYSNLSNILKERLVSAIFPIFENHVMASTL